ncbi:hypothetical protein ABW20_dc0105624 [Dactylellina cionopaga]|nr:hypothetical protein ABW20_dc0105624 [Dactylellina cionopaga]
MSAGTGSTTSLTPSIPSITTTISAPDGGSSSPISRVLSKAKKKKSSQNLNLSVDNNSSLSLSSNENGSVKNSSTTSYIDKIRKRRAERKERKEALENGLSIDSIKPSRSRRNSVAGSLESEASNEVEHDG